MTDVVETLRGGRRAVVQRVRRGDSTVIVKTFTSAGEGWAREAAGLRLLAGRHTAGLIDATPPAIVCEDLGTGPSVADLLLGDNPEAAAEAVTGWAEAIARLHATTLTERVAFETALDEYAGDFPVALNTMPELIADTTRVIAELEPGARLDALEDLTGPEALSPADACPDNNVRRDGRFWLVDFEGAEWRHIAWDVADLTVPWPSCWCSWRLPENVVAHAVERYREIAGEAIPYVRTSAFDHDLHLATAGWAFISCSFTLARALADDPPPADPRVVAPARRAMLLHRLAVAAKLPGLPELSTLAARVRTTLTNRWGEVPLALAPAFRT
ncbi:hypothetical protein [Amycolatopsis sp.]|uniref:phosphotransferase family protein n=1 Tax=Amycolatopsis sp. TaxID=37632 RepID=UPI002C8DF3C1|nr:hypothetical protein [Amycolatopsis sp.]HVV08481.1 hypothetical protein [Amycolatopsis sp.]